MTAVSPLISLVNRFSGDNIPSVNEATMLLFREQARDVFLLNYQSAAPEEASNACKIMITNFDAAVARKQSYAWADGEDCEDMHEPSLNDRINCITKAMETIVDASTGYKNEGIIADFKARINPVSKI